MAMVAFGVCSCSCPCCVGPRQQRQEQEDQIEETRLKEVLDGHYQEVRGMESSQVRANLRLVEFGGPAGRPGRPPHPMHHPTSASCHPEKKELTSVNLHLPPIETAD